MTYKEKLLDPRWQKKRLEVLSRDEFRCRWCGDTESTLHVHHLKYTGNPWEAKTEHLITLCFNCHEEESANRKKDEDALLEAIKLQFFSGGDVLRIAKGFSNLAVFHAPEVMASVIEWALKTPEVTKYLEEQFWEYLRANKEAKENNDTQSS